MHHDHHGRREHPRHRGHHVRPHHHGHRGHPRHCGHAHRGWYLLLGRLSFERLSQGVSPAGRLGPRNSTVC